MIKEFGENYSLSFENHSTIYRFYISVYSPQVIEVNGSAPLVVVVGPPGCGKSTACKLALAAPGSYPGNFFTLFTAKGNGNVSSKNLNGVCGWWSQWTNGCRRCLKKISRQRERKVVSFRKNGMLWAYIFREWACSPMAQRSRQKKVCHGFLTLFRAMSHFLSNFGCTLWPPHQTIIKTFPDWWLLWWRDILVQDEI